MKFTSIIAVLAFAVAASATEPTPTAAPVKVAQVEAKKEMPATAANSASGDATKAPAKKGKKKTAAKK